LPLPAPDPSQGFTAVILTYDRVDMLYQVMRGVARAPSLAKVWLNNIIWYFYRLVFYLVIKIYSILISNYLFNFCTYLYSISDMPHMCHNINCWVEFENNTTNITLVLCEK